MSDLIPIQGAVMRIPQSQYGSLGKIVWEHFGLQMDFVIKSLIQSLTAPFST